MEGFDNINSGPVIEKVWKPTPKQQEVLSCPDSIFELCGGGAAGGGKTDLIVLEDCIRQFTEHPKFKSLILRRTFADLDKEIIPRQQEWYAPMGAVYNETKKYWKFPSGARIVNGHAEREQDVRRYDTAEYNTIKWEEATSFTKFQFLYLSLSRCRSSSPDLPAFIRSYTNPGNVGHAFFKERYVDPAPGGRKIIKDAITGQKRIYIPFSGKDNPHLLINDPGYLKRLEGLPEQEKRSKLYGDWLAYEGQVFSEFRIARIQGEPPNAVHVVSPFPIPEFWPKILVIDWGGAGKDSAMTFAIWAAASPEGRVYIYRTKGWKALGIKVWSRECVNLTADETLEDCVICHSAGANKGEEKTVQQQINDAFEGKYEFRLAPRDRIGGKQLVHEYLRWEPRPKLAVASVVYNHDMAMKLLRIYGEDKYREYLNFFVPEPEEANIPKLQIFSHSWPEGVETKELQDVIPACVPDDTNPEDVKQFPGDDPYDALRMVLKSAARYFEESTDKADEIKKRQEIVDALQVTGNQTSFYMRMEKLEAESGDTTSTRRHRALGSHRYRM